MKVLKYIHLRLFPTSQFVEHSTQLNSIHGDCVTPKQLIYDKIKVFEEGFVCDLLNPSSPFPFFLFHCHDVDATAEMSRVAAHLDGGIKPWHDQTVSGYGVWNTCLIIFIVG